MAAALGIAKTATEIFLGVGQVSIDNLTFKLFYKWSVTLFIVCSVLVCTSQFFGEPVQCETGEDSVDDDVLNSYCWMYSSFDIPPDFEGPCTRRQYDGTKLYNTYYQWVSIFLGALSVLFYIPRCIWMVLEGNLMAYIVKGTTDRVVSDQDEKLSRTLKHFKEYIHNKFNRYAFGFFFCELLNLFLAFIGFWITHRFLNDEFLTYGFDVYRYFMLPAEEREHPDTINPMCEVFPKQAACRYYRYGMGGGSDNRHAMCILGLNMVNDKVFILIWIWFIFLIFMGTMRLCTRSTQLVSSKVRYFLMKLKMNRYFKNHAHMKHIHHYIDNCQIGDWFVLYQMSKNQNKEFFARFLAVLALTVDPDPDVEADEPEIYLSAEEIEKHKTGEYLKNASESDEEEEESGDGEEEKKPFGGIDGLDMELDLNPETAGGGDGLSGKQRMLIKQGKHAKSAQRDAMKARMAMRRKK